MVDPTVARTTVVIPVKGNAESKSRFGPGDHAAFAKAMALDTVEAAARVADIVVVTNAPWATELAELGAAVVADPGGGLIPAIEAGLATVSGATAVLLGDVPGLQGHELGAALEAAASHPRAMVADADGDGTVLVVAQAGQRHSLAFGDRSRAAHAAAGYVDLPGTWPGLRRDVDLPEHLLDLAHLGPRTQLALGR